MIREEKKIVKMETNLLSLVVGGAGAFTTNFKNVYKPTHGYTKMVGLPIAYEAGIDTVSGNRCLAIYNTKTGAMSAGWDFGYGFPTRAWADANGGGADLFKSAFIARFGGNIWYGFGNKSTV